MVDEAEEFWTAHGVPFNRDGWMHILNKHGGHLPIQIEAVAEGTILPTKNVLVQLHNTDPEVPWLTSYIETSLLRAIWYPTTVATNSWHIKQVILKYLEETADDPQAEIAFKLHDFGSRGVSSGESAGIGGCAHLVNFMGTDTVDGALYARKYYGETMAGFSVPAAEHSTITAWGGPKEEVKAFENMLDQFAKPGAIVAVVSDSYDIYAATEQWGTTLKQKVIDSGATIVVRPDSGDPTVVPVEVVELLMKNYGSTINTKGYRILPSCIRVIQGDGVNKDSIAQLLENMKQAGLSASNIGFGMGGALLQELNRDSLEFAMKACAIKVNGVYRDVYKDPVGDSSKKSKRGRLALSGYNGEWETMRHDDIRTENRLQLVFENGKIMSSRAFSDIRKQSNVPYREPIAYAS